MFPVHAATDITGLSLEEAMNCSPASSVTRVEEQFEDQAIVFFLIKGGQDGGTIWIQAALHGDEHDGIIACSRLLGELSPEKLRGNIILCPVANPSAMLAGTNASPLDGINLNRVFGKDAGNTFSYRYGGWLAKKIKRFANFLIDLHGGGAKLDVCSFAMVADDHAEAYKHAVKNIQAVPLTAVFRCNGGTKGMLINEVCRTGIPAVLLESGGGISWSEDGAGVHLASLRIILEQLQMYTFQPEKVEIRAVNHLQREITGVVELRFDCDGVQTFKRSVGDIVIRDEVLLNVLTYPALTERPMLCPIDEGIILSIHAASTVQRGGYAIMLGR
ncbi:M14 family metallopeptidase [Paenibacillus sp. CAU 1782]